MLDATYNCACPGPCNRCGDWILTGDELCTACLHPRPSRELPSARTQERIRRERHLAQIAAEREAARTARQAEIAARVKDLKPRSTATVGDLVATIETFRRPA